MVIQNPAQNKDSGESLSATVKQFPLERRKIAKKMTAAMIFWTILLLVGMFINILIPQSSPFGFFFFSILVAYLLIFFIELWYQKEYYNRYFYNLAADFLVIKKGVIMPHETMLPYEKLQDVYMDQDLLDRLFDIWDVHVSTATAMSGYAAHIDGVSRENAEKLRELILKKIRKEG